MGRICAVLCMVLSLSVLMGFCEIAIHHETHAPSSIQWSIMSIEQNRTVHVLSNANAYHFGCLLCVELPWNGKSMSKWYE